MPRRYPAPPHGEACQMAGATDAAAELVLLAAAPAGANEIKSCVIAVSLLA